MKNNSSNSSALGISGVLTLIFLVLKLVGVISWSWWWVFSPLWIGLAVTALLFAIVIVMKLVSKKRHTN